MSSSSSVFTLRWGIIATGSISSQFTQDLILDPKDRMIPELDGAPKKGGDVDVKHVVTGIGSRSLASAQKFIDANLPEDLRAGCHPYASYDDVFASSDVDIVYIGTPHTYHYENTLAALKAGKHVLCEKPFTFDLAELDELIALAKEKKRFLMEAVWTRFHPIAFAVQKQIFSGEYGAVWRVLADLSLDAGCDEREHPGDRMIDPALGGGSLLDLGPYPMVWTMLALHQNPHTNAARNPPSKITGHMTIYERTGVDASSTWIVEWPAPTKGAKAPHAVCTSSVVGNGSRESSVVVQMEKADLHITFPTYRPEYYKIVPKDAHEPHLTHNDWQHVPIPSTQGRGMNYQADECARRIRDGVLESGRCGWDESRIVMDVFDKVREQGGYVVKKGKAGGAGN